MTVNGKVSESIHIDIGTPQGSRLSPLLFLILMADLNLHVTESHLTNFADDTQSVIIAESKEEAERITQQESEKVLNFFKGVGLVNNPKKAALLVNSDSRGSESSIEVGGIALKSKESEKLLGLHVSSSLDWKTHVDKLIPVLKQRLGILRRIKHKIEPSKMKIIAESIFTSKIRYGLAVYGTPKFDFQSDDPMDSGLQKLACRFCKIR